MDTETAPQKLPARIRRQMRREEQKETRKKNKKDRKKTKKRKREEEGLLDEYELNETKYIFEKGLRFVEPYAYTFTANAKGRWLGLKLIDVLESEFRAETVAYYRKAIKVGLIQMNNKLTDPDHIFTEQDLLMHRVHRHEPPVIGGKIDIIHEDENIIVINKPASMPVHPCGRYRHNSVFFILAAEKGWKNLYFVHRLDRLTSGLMIIAKNTEWADKIGSQIRQNILQKEYLCRTEGEFPEGSIFVDQPILIFDGKLEMNRVDPTGRPSQTRFERVFFDPITNESVVRCFPKTGRTHQIRIHMRHLGFPIKNDPLYNDKYIEKMKNAGKYVAEDDDNLAQTTLNDEEIFKDDVEPQQDSAPSDKKVNLHSLDPSATCRVCRIRAKEPTPDPLPEEMLIYLHARSYSGPEWSYSCAEPEWAQPPTKSN